MVNKLCSSSDDTDPLPINVLITPTPRFLIRVLSLCEALFLIVPLPANIIGFFAEIINSIASLTAL